MNKSYLSRYLVLMLLLASMVLFAPVAFAQSAGGATKITDLMGQRPGNSYYQNSGNGGQTQGSSSTTGSAGASVLQQESSGKLVVDGPAFTISPVQTAKKSSAWKVFATLAVIFLIAAIVLFVLGMKNKKLALSREMAVKADEPKPEEVIVKPVKTERKKPAKKKQANKTKVKRRKKKH